MPIDLGVHLHEQGLKKRAQVLAHSFRHSGRFNPGNITQRNLLAPLGVSQLRKSLRRFRLSVTPNFGMTHVVVCAASLAIRRRYSPSG
jgi:hypothetical protein